MASRYEHPLSTLVEFVGNRLGRHSPYGFVFNTSDANRVYFNRAISNDHVGFFLWGGNHNLVFCNDFQGHVLGAELLGQALGNQIWLNNFYLNDSAIDLVGGGLNTFDHPRPKGGNFWKPHTPNCADGNGDGFCDAPYVFRGNQDDLPHVAPIPWLADPSICMVPPKPPPYGENDEQIQIDAVLSSLAKALEIAIGEGRLDRLLPSLSIDVSLAAGDLLVDGREAVAARLGELLACAGGTPKVSLVSDPEPAHPAVAEFEIEGCGNSVVELVAVIGYEPGQGKGKIDHLVFSAEESR